MQTTGPWARTSAGVWRTFAVSLAACTLVLVSGPPARAAWEARHGLSPSEYQETFDALNAKGYRLVSVSGYLSGGKELYAALWTNEQGPAWHARHGLSGDEYQKAFDHHLRQGYRLVWVSAHQYPPLVGSVRYAAIWEKRRDPAAWEAVHGLDADEYQAAFDKWVKQGYRLAHVYSYASGTSARYAAIWSKSQGPAFEARHGLTADEYQKEFDALGKKGYRPKVVSGVNVAGKDYYTALWVKRGDTWSARHGISESSYQGVFDNYKYQGYEPNSLTAFGSGSSARFNGVWTNRSFKASDLEAIREAMEGALKTANVAGASIAVGKDGRLVYASGFGDADKENGIEMGASHRLRIGSISKTITAVAIFQLIEEKAQYGGGKTLALSSPVFGSDGVLGGKIAVPSLLEPLKDAQVKHLLEHTSGIPSNAGDPVNCSEGDLNERIEYQLKQIKAVAASSESPVGPVPRAPGDKFDYSNLNFIILESIIEALSGQSYETYVRKHVFASDVTEPRLFRIGPYAADSGEAKHYRADGSYAEYAPANTCDMKPPGVGAGGWAMSAKDLLRHLVRVDGLGGEVLEKENRDKMLTPSPVWATYGRGWMLGSWGSCSSSWSIAQGHNGGLSGAFSDLFLLPNGMSFALIVNQDAASSGRCTPVATTASPSPAKVACGGDNQPGCGDEVVARLVELLGKVTWPSYDLF